MKERISGKKTVYWKIKERKAGSYLIEFWRKPDKKDALVETFVILDDQRLRYRVEMVTGLKNFDLVQEK